LIGIGAAVTRRPPSRPGDMNLRLGPIIKKIWPPVAAQAASRVRRQDGKKSKSAEWTQLARGTLNRYLLILKRLIFESSVRAGRPNLVAAPDRPETRPWLCANAASIISFSCLTMIFHVTKSEMPLKETGLGETNGDLLEADFPVLISSWRDGLLTDY
jgi:hypothetical protein